MDAPTAPPPALVASLVDGPSLVTAVEWHERIDSTNRRAFEAGHREGGPPGLLVVADEQTAGRGRQGRGWSAPPGSSLMLSVLLERGSLGGVSLLPLTVGVAIAEAARAHAEGAEIALKWPNDLLARRGAGGWGKAGGILVESDDRWVVVGCGINVDWRGLERPETPLPIRSLSEVANAPVDRWRLLAGLCGVLTNRLDDAARDPERIRGAYRDRCATLGQQVRVTLPGAGEVHAHAADLTLEGALVLDDGADQRVIHVGDVEHLAAEAEGHGGHGDHDGHGSGEEG